jgi:molybdate transport system ATP-binding protein
VADRLIASFVRRYTPTVSVRVDLELEAGDSRVLVLFGPSGSGKTTILRCLAGLDRPQEGFIRFGAEIWFDAATGVNRSPQARRLAYVAQDYGLFPHLTVGENVRFGMDVHRSAATPRVESILERVHLGGMAGRLPGQLSGGERQRVALARALARDPALVLLDEPLAALDLPLRDPMRQELRQFLRSLDVPSVIVTHDRVDALTLGDRMAVLSGGFIRQVGSVPEVFSRPADVAVAASVGVENVVAGTVVETVDGLATVRVSDGSIRAAANLAAGPVFVCIRAEDVILERSQHGHVSARNQWTGRVVALQSEGSVVRVTVDCGFVLTALITRPSLDELQVAPGSTVTALVKATAVHLVQRGPAQEPTTPTGRIS